VQKDSKSVPRDQEMEKRGCHIPGAELDVTAVSARRSLWMPAGVGTDSLLRLLIRSLHERHWFRATHHQRGRAPFTPSIAGIA